MICLELVGDRETKAPADASVVATVSDHCYEHGVIVRASGNNVIISPPLIVTEADVTRILTALDGALGVV